MAEPNESPFCRPAKHEIINISSTCGGGGDDPGAAMRAAIEARRAKQEARAAAIERGELAVEDPREKRLREEKEKQRGERKAAGKR